MNFVKSCPIDDFANLSGGGVRKSKQFKLYRKTFIG